MEVLENLALFGMVLLTGLIVSPIFIISASLPLIYRLLRLKMLARKYNLSFESRFFKDITWDNRKDLIRNRIAGTINNQAVEIFDQVTYKGIPVYSQYFENYHGLSKNEGAISKRSTAFVVDAQNVMTKKGFIMGYASIRSIHKFLEDLSHGIKT